MRINPTGWRSAASKALMAWLLGASVAQASVIWLEQDPPGAGDLIATAQVTKDSALNPLSGINGTLKAFTPVSGTPVYEVDLYKTYISDFAIFSARSVSSNPDDTALFLFDSAGRGVYMNDDDGVDLLSLLPAGDANSPASNGFFYLAIGLGGFEAFDSFNVGLFLAGAFTDVRAGDPLAGMLDSWASPFGGFFEQPLDYQIVLTGARVAEFLDGTPVSEPASLSLVLLALAGIAASRSSAYATRRA